MSMPNRPVSPHKLTVADPTEAESLDFRALKAKYKDKLVINSNPAGRKPAYIDQTRLMSVEQIQKSAQDLGMLYDQLPAQLRSKMDLHEYVDVCMGIHQNNPVAIARARQIGILRTPETGSDSKPLDANCPTDRFNGQSHRGASPVKQKNVSQDDLKKSYQKGVRDALNRIEIDD